MITGLSTVILFVAFIAAVAWAFSKRRKSEFDQASRIPLEDQSENLP